VIKGPQARDPAARMALGWGLRSVVCVMCAATHGLLLKKTLDSG
jgi:hypothetical protein